MHSMQLSPFLLPLVLAPLARSATLRCENIRVDDHSFDLSALGGPHSVVTSRHDALVGADFNTTYTIDICRPLKKSGDSKKSEQCPNGTRVCAITHLLKPDTDDVSKVIAIAGGLENVGGSEFDFDVERLKTSDSNPDPRKEGLRVVLKGGNHPLDRSGREQRAVVEFLCDPDKKGTEGEWTAEDKYENSKLPRRDDGDGDDGEEGDESSVEHQLKTDDAALIWESYGPKESMDVLHLTWHTKYACEERSPDDDDDGEVRDGSGSWGFFTWLVIIAFLGIAAYLIFGSWLNYTRYGARGWDLVPHGDTIRDIPYLLKDWTRRVLNTVQGTGSRGGYSAV